MVDTWVLYVRGLRVTGMWLESGALSSLSPGAAKFGSVLSSSPYLVLQVIRLTHKGGCGPLGHQAATERGW